MTEFEPLIPACQTLLDPHDAHVLAAALKAQAAIIVTENLSDFPAEILDSLNLDAKSADAFIADTLSLDIGRGVAAVRTMRERLKRPALSPQDLLLKMEADAMAQTVDTLRAHIQSL